MNYLTTNWRRQFVFVAFTAFVFLFTAQFLTAQTAPRKYKAGDVIEVGNDTTLEIVECRAKPNTRNEEECDYIAFRGGSSPSNIVTDSVFNIRRYEQLAAAEKKRLEVINRRAQPKNQQPPPVEQTSEKTESEGNTSSEEAELTVTAKQLYDEYNNNDTAAKRKYVGKIVRVTGAVVYTISETRFSARFNKIYSGSTIQCYLEDIEQAVTLNKGETVTLVGVPLGSLTSTGVIFEPCRIERKTANQTTKTTTPKTPVKPPIKTTGGNAVGTWYYTAIINADGTEQKLNNSESYLWLKEDGSYENRFGNFGQIGTFAVGASRLTLNREDGDKKVYTMTIAGTTMTLKHASGGYKLERE